MKKIIFTLMMMLVTALAVNAQNLVGRQWCTVLNDEDGEGIAAVTVPGTYKLDGKDLNNQFNNGKAKVEVDYEIKGMDAKTKALLNKQIKGELNTLKAEFKKGLLGGMPKMDNLKIVKLESKKLVLKNDDNQEIPFYDE